ncbi:NADH (or F420H2) dehydrogenase subunit C [groundwater metagenome]
MNPAEELKYLLPTSVISVGVQTNKPLAVIKKEDMLKVAAKVKEMGFDHLSVITGMDCVDRVEVIYNFFSYKKKQNLALKVVLDHSSPEVDSVTSIWKVADWLERWMGHPLRKDYDMSIEQFVTVGEDGEDIVSTDGSNLLRRK